WAAKGLDEQAIHVWALEGNRRGWDPKWLTPGQVSPDEPDLRREHIDITCPGPRCSQRSYRSDYENLQTLLMKVATDADLCSICGQPFAVILWADANVIVMKLSMLELAHQHAERHYGLPV